LPGTDNQEDPMQRYEYKVVPAPQKGIKAKGEKTAEGRFAASVEQVLNQMGQDGWEYQRAELLPSEERAGLTSSTVNWRNVLVFRREIATDVVATPTDESTAQAKPIPGPEPVQAPAPISEEVKEPPLSLKGAEQVSEPPKDENAP
jgi:hypothetical protein